MSIKVKVTFDSPVYYAGETVRAEVNMLVPVLPLNQTTPDVLRQTLIFFDIKGKSRWMMNGYGYDESEKEGGKMQDGGIFFREFQSRFENGNKDHVLTPGIHKYPLEVKLPENLPSTITSSYGRIYYKLVVYVRQGGWQLTYPKKFPFEVRGVLNLGAMALEPLALDVSKPVLHLSLPAGCVNIQFRMARAALICGNSVPFFFKVSNMSSGIGYELHVELLQTLEFTNGKEVKSNISRTKPVASAKRCIHYVHPSASCEWAEASLDIPFTLPPTFHESQIISISYAIGLEVKFKGIGWQNVKEFIPVVLGSAWHSAAPPRYEDIYYEAVQPAPTPDLGQGLKNKKINVQKLPHQYVNL